MVSTMSIHTGGGSIGLRGAGFASLGLAAAAGAFDGVSALAGPSESRTFCSAEVAMLVSFTQRRPPHRTGGARRK